MPPIRPTDLCEWREQSRRWHRRRPGRDPLELARAVRQEDIRARCAFYVAALDRRIQADTPGAEACSVCGYPTHSWCEGCYARVTQQPSCDYSAVCQPCDATQKVCDLCVRVGINYAQGRAAYNATKEIQIPETTPEEQEGVEVTGWRDTSGQFTTQPTTRLTFAQISEATGIPIEEVRQQLSFTPPGQSWSSTGACPPSLSLWQAGAVHPMVGGFRRGDMHGFEGCVGLRPELGGGVRSGPWAADSGGCL